MTKKEAVIIAAYTGIMIGEFHELHKYIEEIMERPVFTHELGSKKIAAEIKEKARSDFLKLEVRE